MLFRASCVFKIVWKLHFGFILIEKTWCKMIVSKAITKNLRKFKLFCCFFVVKSCWFRTDGFQNWFIAKNYVQNALHFSIKIDATENMILQCRVFGAFGSIIFEENRIENYHFRFWCKFHAISFEVFSGIWREQVRYQRFYLFSDLH